MVSLLLEAKKVNPFTALFCFCYNKGENKDDELQMML